MRDKKDSRQPGFTLIELGIVIAIIGILISLILVAGAEGVRRAEERQTQALIIKLETALSERVEALLTSSAPINQTHRYLAAITYLDTPNYDPILSSIDRRAQVIAQFDYMKAELPDVFYTNNINSGNVTNDAQYPFNFAMPPYPITATGTAAYALPLGNRQPGLPYTQTTAGSTTPAYAYPTPGFDPITGLNDNGVAAQYLPAGLLVVQDTGIYGASFAAMGSLTKNLYESAATTTIQKLGLAANQESIVAKLGYDGVDNDGDYYVDNINEVTPGLTYATQFQNQVNLQLANHDHKTARAEMLYALLVEGQGPLGSAFNASDFTNRDVADTDGDGMPEFIDAWGQPLQFYRWPIFYGTAGVGSPSPSDSQHGYDVYGYQQRRQLDPLDPNQLLTSVAWWSNSYLGNAANQSLPTMVTTLPTQDFSTGYSGSVASPQANAFMTYFHIIIDPQVNTVTSPSPPGSISLWDRTGYSRRRAYYSKFLVLSGGPDKEIGVFRLNKNYLNDLGSPDPTFSALSPAYPAAGFPTGNQVTDCHLLNWCESQAAQVEGTGRGGVFLEQLNNSAYPVAATPTSLYLQQNSGLDDISNHALSAPGTGAK